MTADQVKTERLIAVLGNIIMIGALLVMVGFLVVMAGVAFDNPDPVVVNLHLILFGLIVVIMSKTMLGALDYKPRLFTWSVIHSRLILIHSKLIEATDWSFLSPDDILSLTAGKGEISQIITISPIELIIPPKPALPPTIDLGPGFIYVMRRRDGIYKFGRAIDPNQRLLDHQETYKQDFRLIRWFAVSDMVAFERLALTMTKPYIYKKEAGRRELRRMTKAQLSSFLIGFEQLVKGDIKQ